LIWLIKKLLSYLSLPLFQPSKLHLEVESTSVKMGTDEKSSHHKGQAQVFTIAPSSVMPYMTAYTNEVEKALFLRRFGVPFWALAYVFGRDEAYWYRLAAQFGRYHLVQTTVKAPEKLPKDLLADEKFANFNGERAYIATTVGGECVLGASLALAAGYGQPARSLWALQSRSPTGAAGLCPADGQYGRLGAHPMRLASPLPADCGDRVSCTLISKSAPAVGARC
jgi:hypothetical protein